MASNVLEADDGHVIALHRWLVPEPRAIVHLLHGLGEHAGRYARFAGDCNARGIAVVAHDHRGHGAGAAVRGHFADRDGWRRVLSDVGRVRQSIEDEYPGVPLILMGHSMGSFIARAAAPQYSARLSMLVLSGSTWSNRPELAGGRLLAGLLTRIDARGHSGLLDRLGFGRLNDAFRPPRTPYDWLSRDDAEVDRYLADPLCGGPFSNALWRDLLLGLMAITRDAAVQAIPATLPVYLFGGSDDPVGGRRGLKRLLAAFERTGHEDVTLQCYEGGRHEMLNEVNRDQVVADLLAWIDSRLPSPR